MTKFSMIDNWFEYWCRNRQGNIKDFLGFDEEDYSEYLVQPNIILKRHIDRKYKKYR